MTARSHRSSPTRRTITGIAAEIATAIGADAAAALIGARGGTTFYVPSAGRLTNKHWLVELLGREVAERLCDYFSFSLDNHRHHGVAVELPSGHALKITERNLAVRDMTRAGRSVPEIALSLGVSGRTVRKIRASLREAGELP